VSVEPILFGLGFLRNFVECRDRDAAIEFGGVCRILSMGVSTVVDAVGAVVDGWLVSVADPDG
jgi:hypothetical protein